MPRAELTHAVVLAVLRGEEDDDEILASACDVARRKSARLRGLYVLEVPPTLPLGSWDEERETRARSVLSAAQETAGQSGCRLEGRVRPARHVGQAIVDEAVELAALSIVMGRPHPSRGGEASTYVLDKAVCTVLVLQAKREAPGGRGRGTS